MDNKLPYKVFGVVIAFVSVVTFFIMNYNSVPVSFIFFICFFMGGIAASFYWYQRYKSLEKKYERTEKLLFTKEKLEDDSEE